jgi:hypothetical protein
VATTALGGKTVVDGCAVGSRSVTFVGIKKATRQALTHGNVSVLSASSHALGVKSFVYGIMNRLGNLTAGVDIVGLRDGVDDISSVLAKAHVAAAEITIAVARR